MNKDGQGKANTDIASLQAQTDTLVLVKGKSYICYFGFNFIYKSRVPLLIL